MTSLIQLKNVEKVVDNNDKANLNLKNDNVIIYDEENDPGLDDEEDYDTNANENEPEINEYINNRFCNNYKNSKKDRAIPLENSLNLPNSPLTSSINDCHNQLNNEQQPDTTSSIESGFGTVDDDLENSNPNNHNLNLINAKYEQKENIANQDDIHLENREKKIEQQNISINMENIRSKVNNLNTSVEYDQAHLSNSNQTNQQKSGLMHQQSIDSTSSHQSDNRFLQQQVINLPILQAPRQIIYELNKNNTNNNNNSNSRDDIVNILNDNSSINSSSSSTNSNRYSNCCSMMIDKFTKFYYSCFCCYSTASHNNQTPLFWSWLSIFCCCCPLLGGISLYFTHRSKKLKLKQKYELAEKYSNYAEKLNIASLIFGVIFYAIAFFMITLVIFMYWRHNNS